MTFGSDGTKERARNRSDCKKLQEALVAWREKTFDSDAISSLFDIQDIDITEEGIGLIAKLPPSQVRSGGPEVITKELGETVEWGSRYARELFERIQEHDCGINSS